MEKMSLGEPFCRNQAPLVVPDNCILYQLVEVTALKAAERRKTVRSKLPVQQSNAKIFADTVESCEPCDYCVDRQHPNCKDRRTEYFPSCFKGRKLRHC
jgi:hypothetical protein